VATADAQQLTARVSAESNFWRAINAVEDIYSVIHRHRESLVLAWVDELGARAGGTALEVGCGAGLMAIELAQRGMRVEATDAVEATVDVTRRHAVAAGVGRLVHVAPGDADAFAFADRSFELVVAVGVIPWLRSPPSALAEMARVLKPAGLLIVNWDNVDRLDYRLDPARTRRLAGLRQRVTRTVPSSSVRAPSFPLHQYSIDEFHAMLRSAGLSKEKEKTLGFGPFTVFGRHVVPRRLEVPLHRRLQHAADNGSTALGSRGTECIVAARKL
jgi:ubiquinone/menaquinone biosynthesis C-methylase UbiE